MVLFVYFYGVLVIGVVTASPFIEQSSSQEIVEIGSKQDVNFRLPNNTKPLEYVINIETKIHQHLFDFSGDVFITIKALETNQNSKIVVHARQLTNFIPKVYHDNGTEFKNIDFNYDKETEFLTVFSKSNDLTLIEDNIYKLKISYKGILREDNGGFYRSSYLKTNGERIYLATTQFESTDARHGFPCYDEPGIKAKFSIAITHGSNYTAISNMPGTSRASKPNMMTTTFDKTPSMSTYLVAFIVSNFEYTSTMDKKDREERVYSRPGTKSEQKFALDTSVKTLNGLENYLKIKYSLPKMDQVAVPDFAAGAMENWGLVTYREEYLLYNAEKYSILTETNVASIIAHEYAHQWFGNLVSPKWWTWTWLNEGFASLFSYIATDMVYPKWNIMENFIVADYQRALLSDVGNTARPMTHYVQKPKEIVSVFDSISYSKAACVLRMIQHVISDEVFAQGLNKYLNEMKYSAAEEDDLFRGLQWAVDKNKIDLPTSIETIMKSWTNQKGFPILTVTRNYKSGNFRIEQESFHNTTTIKDNRLWWIPYNFVTANNNNFSDTKFVGFMKQEKFVDIIPNIKKTWTNRDWLILNVQQTGYYRVNYDNNNWNLIINALTRNPNDIHPYNRAQLINDAFRLVFSERLDLNILLSLLNYLKKEESYAPWVSGSNALNTFNLFLRGDDNSKYFDFFIRSIVEDVYKKLGIKDQPNEKHFTKYTRLLVIKWACEASIEDCLKTTNDRLGDFVNNITTIEPNLKDAIYCYGLKKATNEQFEFLYKRLMRSLDAAERQLLITSLGCSSSPKQLEMFLKSSVSSSPDITLRPQERIVLVKATYSKGQIGFSAALDFLIANYKEYAKLTPGFLKKNPLFDDIAQMSALVVTTDQKTKLDKLLKLAQTLPNFDEELLPVVEKNIQSNMEWINLHKESVLGWLKEYEKNSKGGAKANSVVPILVLLGSILALCFRN